MRRSGSAPHSGPLQLCFDGQYSAKIWKQGNQYGDVWQAVLSEPELRRRHRPRHLDFVSRPLAMTAPDALSLASQVEGGNNCVYGRQWYEKAAALGSEAASQRLAKLAHSGQ